VSWWLYFYCVAGKQKKLKDFFFLPPRHKGTKENGKPFYRNQLASLNKINPKINGCKVIRRMTLCVFVSWWLYFYCVAGKQKKLKDFFFLPPRHKGTKENGKRF
jgi:hypothetical protein